MLQGDRYKCETLGSSHMAEYFYMAQPRVFLNHFQYNEFEDKTKAILIEDSSKYIETVKDILYYSNSYLRIV